MKRISRRAFCGTCAAIGVSAVARGRLDGAQIPVAQREFVIGSLSSATGNVLYVQSANGLRTVQLSASVRVWREADDLPSSSLRPGDHVLLRLEPSPVGTYLATRIYANIVNYYGLVAGRNTSGMALLRFTSPRQPMSELVDVTFSNNLSYVSINGIQADVGQIRPGQFVQVIGMKAPGQRLRGTRIFASGG